MRIASIDLGTHSVKLLEMDSVFGRFEIHDQHERKLDTATSESPAQAAATLLSGLAKKPDRVVVLLRSQASTLRTLNLPTKDKKAVRASIQFELEDDLPFEADQSVYDYSILSQTRNSTRAHIAVTTKEQLTKFLDDLKLAGVDPDIVTTECWAWRSVMNRVLPAADQLGPVVTLHLGHQRSLLYAHYQQAPLFVREIPWSGQELALSVCKKLGIPLDQAEALVRDKGAVLSGQQRVQYPADVQALATAIDETLDGLVSDIRQATLSAKGSAEGKNVTKLYLTGSLSMIPGLADALGSALSVEIAPLRALSTVSASGVSYSEPTENAFPLALGGALALLGPEKNLVVNFRMGAFAKRAPGKSLKQFEALKRPLIGLSIVMATLYVSLFVERIIYQSRLTDLDAQLEKSVKSFFGQISPSATRTYLANISSLKNAMQKELKRQRELQKLLSTSTRFPIDHLKELSRAIPRDLTVDMMSYQVGAAPSEKPPQPPETAKLMFWVSSAKDAERLTEHVAKKVADLQSSPAEPVTVGGKKRFKISFNGRPTEDSYGQH